MSNERGTPRQLNSGPGDVLSWPGLGTYTVQPDGFNIICDTSHAPLANGIYCSGDMFSVVSRAAPRLHRMDAAGRLMPWVPDGVSDDPEIPADFEAGDYEAQYLEESRAAGMAVQYQHMMGEDQ